MATGAQCSVTSLTDSGGDIGDLISDAMEDTPPTHASRSPHRALPRQRLPQAARPPPREARDFEKSLLMEFESDSDDNSSSKKPSSLSPPPGKLEQGDIFSDSDDEFYIVDTPTSTKVVRYLIELWP